MDDASTVPYQSKPLSRTIWSLYVNAKAEIMVKIVYKSYQLLAARSQLNQFSGDADLLKIMPKRGFSLLEVMIAVAIIGIVVSGFMSGMNVALKGALKTDRLDTARTLAVGQMEYVKTLPFAASYAPGDSTVYASAQNKFINYAGYSATITSVNAAQRNVDIQKITVTIFYNGINITTLDDCKVK